MKIVAYFLRISVGSKMESNSLSSSISDCSLPSKKINKRKGKKGPSLSNGSGWPSFNSLKMKAVWAGLLLHIILKAGKERVRSTNLLLM